MTIITATKTPLYWGVEKTAETGVTNIGELTISGQVLISDDDPKAFLSKIIAFPVTKTIPTSDIGSVYKDCENKLCLVKIDKTIEVPAVAVEVKPTEEVKVDEKIIK